MSRNLENFYTNRWLCVIPSFGTLLALILVTILLLDTAERMTSLCSTLNSRIRSTASSVKRYLLSILSCLDSDHAVKLYRIEKGKLVERRGRKASGLTVKTQDSGAAKLSIEVPPLFPWHLRKAAPSAIHWKTKLSQATCR